MPTGSAAPPPEIPPLGHAELEAELHRLLGRTVVACSRLDLVVALCLAASARRAGVPITSQAIDELSTSEKLSELQLQLSKRPLNSEATASMAEWFTKAHSLRQLRNSFVHGRWGTAPLSQELCFVPAGLPGLRTDKASTEQRYALSDLNAEVADIESLAGQLVGFRRRYGF